MKIYKLILIILVFFLKTGNVLSDNNIFNVNNIEIKKKGVISNKELSNTAIKKGFNELLNKILLKEDYLKLRQMKLSEIKDLVNYYQMSNKTDNNENLEKIIFNITFDKDKIHNLFYNKNISYSEIINKEVYILPILKKNNQVFIYSQNYFYDNWNIFHDKELLEFILPLENIEIIQNINLHKNNLLDLELRDLFFEYSGNNLALVLIELNNQKEEKLYLKTEILDKKIVKNINIKRFNLSEEEYFKKIIIETKKEITNLIKSQSLIDIKTPSFLKAQFKIKKNNSLVQLKSQLAKIGSIENIYIEKFSKETVFLKIKYLGKLNKMLNQLKNNKIILKSSRDQWFIELTQ